MAITVDYDVVKADMNDKPKLALLRDFDQVLSLNLTTGGAALREAGNSIDPERETCIQEKIKERADAKKAKDFAKADAIRDELRAKGIVIKDTREGTVYEVQY